MKDYQKAKSNYFLLGLKEEVLILNLINMRHFLIGGITMILLLVSQSIFAQIKVTTQTSALTGGLLIKGGTNLEQKNASDGIYFLIEQVKSTDFENCLSRAFLVEHQDKSSAQIAQMFLSDKIVEITIKELGARVNGRAKVKISEEKLYLDDDFVRNSTIERIAGVIAHELAHNFGFRHQMFDFGNIYYRFTVPEQVEACVCKGRPNPRITRPTITNIGDAVVTLYEGVGFNDRKLTLNYNNMEISNLGNAQSDDGKLGFNDKASSMTWQIPYGYEMVIYEDNRFEKPIHELVGDGEFKEVVNLSKEGINDKASSIRWFRTSPPVITNPRDAFVELYDDNNFSDRRLTIRYNQNISNLESTISDNGQRGFNDKTSSVRFQIPRGYKLVLYDDKGYSDRKLELIGTGRLEDKEYRNLDSKNFGDKTSSLRWERTSP